MALYRSVTKSACSSKVCKAFRDPLKQQITSLPWTRAKEDDIKQRADRPINRDTEHREGIDQGERYMSIKQEEQNADIKIEEETSLSKRKRTARKPLVCRLAFSTIRVLGLPTFTRTRCLSSRMAPASLCIGIHSCMQFK
jgi:hypothetical protein